MHEPARLDTGGGADSELEDLRQVERSVIELVPEVQALHERHDEEEVVLELTEIVNRDDVGVIHLRDDARLAEEARPAVRREHALRHDLHRDVAIEKRIAPEVDRAHSPAPELANDLVAVTELRADDAPPLPCPRARSRPGRFSTRLHRWRLRESRSQGIRA